MLLVFSPSTEGWFLIMGAEVWTAQLQACGLSRVFPVGGEGAQSLLQWAQWEPSPKPGG